MLPLMDKSSWLVQITYGCMLVHRKFRFVFFKILNQNTVQQPGALCL